MRVGTPEHDDYLRELMKLPRQTLPKKAVCAAEQEWRAQIAAAAFAQCPDDMPAVRDLIQRAIDRGAPLPALTHEQKQECLRQAVHSACLRLGEPSADQQAAFDDEVDRMYSAACDIHRERSAASWIQSYFRLRRLELLPGIRAFLNLETIDE